MSPENISETKSVCIASGKGGVGKSTIAVNLAVELAKKYKVLLFDADMGLANVHAALNIKLAEKKWEAIFLNGDLLRDMPVKTEYNFDLISGANGSSFLASLDTSETMKLIRNFDVFTGLYDYIIIDSAAGVSPSVLTFLAASNLRIVVGNNESGSILDAYGLIKSMHRNSDFGDIYFLGNRVSLQDGQRLFDQMNSAIYHFLNIQIDHIGSLIDDPFISTCWNRSVPILSSSPHCKVSLQLVEIAQKISGLAVSEARINRFKFLRTANE